MKPSDEKEQLSLEIHCRKRHILFLKNTFRRLRSFLTAYYSPRHLGKDHCVIQSLSEIAARIRTESRVLREMEAALVRVDARHVRNSVAVEEVSRG